MNVYVNVCQKENLTTMEMANGVQPSRVCPSANARVVSLRCRGPSLNVLAIWKREKQISYESLSFRPILCIRRFTEAVSVH